jgi:GNAT superfamily N-acetyltransferase
MGSALRPSHLSRLLSRVRVRGLRRTVRAGLQAYVYSNRRWYIFVRALRPGGHAPPNPAFTYREATLADLESFAAFEPNRKRREFRAWLEAGAIVVAAFDGDKPVAFQSFDFAVPVGPPLSSLELAPGEIWSIDVQTLPAYRRHGAAASLRAHRDDTLAPRGIHAFVSSVQDDNLPALSYAFGAIQVGDGVRLLSYRCLLGFRRIRIEEGAAAKLERRLLELRSTDDGRDRSGHDPHTALE